MNVIKIKTALFRSLRGKVIVVLCGISFLSLVSVAVLSYIFSRSLLNSEINQKMKNQLEIINQNINLTMSNTAGVATDIARLAEVRNNSFSRDDYLNFMQMLSRYMNIPLAQGYGLSHINTTALPDSLGLMFIREKRAL